MTEQIPKASLMVKSLCGNSRKKFSLEKQQFYCWFILESFKKIEIRAPSGNLIVYIIWNTAHHLNLNSNYCQRKITICIRYCERIVISVYLCRCCCYLMLPLYTHTHSLHHLANETWLDECVVIFEPLIMSQSSSSYFWLFWSFFHSRHSP